MSTSEGSLIQRKKFKKLTLTSGTRMESQTSSIGSCSESSFQERTSNSVFKLSIEISSREVT
jgi:hypothetical protein